MGELIRTTDLHRQFRLGDTVVRAVDGIDLTVAEGGSSASWPQRLRQVDPALPARRARPATSGERSTSVGGGSTACPERDGPDCGAGRSAVFQSFNLVDNLSVLQNVQLQAMLGGWPEPGRQPPPGRRCWSWVWATRPKPCRPCCPAGSASEVAIARALMNEPPLLLADEPTGNLDSATTTDVLGLLRGSTRAPRRSWW